MVISISSLTQSEFLNIVGWNKAMLNRLLDKMSYKQQLYLRKDIQIALTHYSKGKPVLNAISGDKVEILPNGVVVRGPHEVQIRAIKICQHIERRLRANYMRDMKYKIALKYPEFFKNPQKLKSLAKRQFEKFLKKFRSTIV